MDDTSVAIAGASADNDCIPAGFTFFGQLIAHDITADRSLLRHHAVIGELRNFRTPGWTSSQCTPAGQQMHRTCTTTMTPTNFWSA